LSILEFIKNNFSEISLSIYTAIDQLPHFNPDRDKIPFPESVSSFRRAIKASDGVLICTPEYAMGIPGSLKNAIDWTVSSAEFSKKPVALITASSSGQKGHAALLDVLEVIEASIPESSRLLLSFVKTKVKEGGTIDDPATRHAIELVMRSLINDIKRDGKH
jgi:NAD(P)H-dependent FMN reductase